MAPTLKAALAVSRGKPDAAIAILRGQLALDPPPPALITEPARYRLGKLLGGDEGAALVAQAEDHLRGNGVVDIERFMGALAPGFERP